MIVKKRKIKCVYFIYVGLKLYIGDYDGKYLNNDYNKLIRISYVEKILM